MKANKIIFFVIFILLQSFTGNEQLIRKTQAEFSRKIYNDILPTYKRILKDSLEMILKEAKIIPNEYKSMDEFYKDSLNMKYIFIPHFYVNENLLCENPIKPWFNLDCDDISFKCIIFKKEQFYLLISINSVFSYVSKYSNWIIEDTTLTQEQKDYHFKAMKEIYCRDFDVVFNISYFLKSIGFVVKDSIYLVSYLDYNEPEDFKEYWFKQERRYVEIDIKSNPCNEEKLKLKKKEKEKEKKKKHKSKK